jgi:hypothetical protein
MNGKICAILLGIILIFSGNKINAASYYVDNLVSTSGDGSSWGSAWKNFSDINWGAVSPGDIIYISGGANSQTYTGTLYLGSGVSGTSSNPVVITKGETAGYNGEVIFDGQNAASSGIIVLHNDYVTIRQLTLRNYTGSGAINIDNSTGVVVENCDFLVAGHGGVFIQRTTDSFIRNNTIATLGNTTNQTDGIYSQLNSNNTYEGNEIVISNENINPHCDGIQMYVDADMTIRNNYIAQNNSKTYNAQGIYATDVSGTFNVYNNVIYGPNTENALLTLAIFSQGNGTLIAKHNTLIGGGWGSLHVRNAPNSVIMNNILVNYKPNGWVFKLYGGITDPANINNNDYFTPNSGTIATYDDVAKTWTEWKNYGFESHGMYGDPLLRNAANGDFRLQDSSPLIDAGSSGCNIDTDIDGVHRPQGAHCDIGAYEFLVHVPPRPPENFHQISTKR